MTTPKAAQYTTKKCHSIQEDTVKNLYELLKSFAFSKVAIGAVAFMVVYMVRGSGVGCLLCGNQGLHPWEWGGFVGL